MAFRPGHDQGEGPCAATVPENRMCLIGPNCAGIIHLAKALLGIMPGNIYLSGHVGIVGRSGTLGYEAAAQMKELGIGVSTSVGIGGDPINGSSFKDILELFKPNLETHAVVMIGEGGDRGSEAAEYIRDHMKKPVIAVCCRMSAPRAQDGPRRCYHLGLRRAHQKKLKSSAKWVSP
jgi:succinyl-CoA synthetase alpha subunit